MYRQDRKKTNWKPLIGWGVAAAVVFYAGSTIQPHVESASTVRVKAALPWILRQEPEIPIGAPERFQVVTTLLVSLDQSPGASLSDPQQAIPSTRLKLAAKFAKNNKYFLDQLTLLLDQGPLYAADPPDGGDIELATVKSLSSAAKVFAEHSQFEDSTKMFLLAIRLMEALNNGRIGALGTLMELIVLKDLSQSIAKTYFPTDNCQKILAKLPASPAQDEILRDQIRNYFTASVLPLIGSASAVVRSEQTPGDSAVIGSYDPIMTAKALGSAVAEQMDNALKPLSQVKSPVSEKIAEQRWSLPTPQGASGINFWDGFLYRFAMNRQPNGIGRKFAYDCRPPRKELEFACRYRALRDCVRVQLACQIYRATHRDLPADRTELVPLIGEWPKDPYNGNPLQYDAANQVVYAIGPDLKDDLGQIGSFDRDGLDIGVALSR